MTPSTIFSTTIAAELDRKLAGVEPLLDVVDWYGKIYLANSSLDERSYSANEIAALNFGLENYTTEAEIATRPCRCMRPDPNVCQCYATLKAARAASAHAPAQELAQEPVLDPVPESSELGYFW